MIVFQVKCPDNPWFGPIPLPASEFTTDVDESGRSVLAWTCGLADCEQRHTAPIGRDAEDRS